MSLRVELLHTEEDVAGDGVGDILIICKSECQRGDDADTRFDSRRDVAFCLGVPAVADDEGVGPAGAAAIDDTLVGVDLFTDAAGPAAAVVESGDIVEVGGSAGAAVAGESETKIAVGVACYVGERGVTVAVASLEDIAGSAVVVFDKAFVDEVKVTAVFLVDDNLVDDVEVAAV